MNHFKLVVFFICILFTGKLSAQGNRLIGTLYNPDDQTTLVGATIKLSNAKDTTKFKYTNSDIAGKFEFAQLSKGAYLLDITYIGYENFRKRVSVNNKVEDLGKLLLKSSATKLKEVSVTGDAIRAEQKGDTTQYSSAAYKVTQDANTEDLVKKMPGITVENGTVKSQGEDIKKVLVDGKQFFGDDPTVVLKNLPAEVIDKIQVFDKLSDQSAWSGFDDGNAQKTMNIVTKSVRNNGQFGKFTAGYGSDGRYQAGVNLNLFDKNQRITIIGNANNINLQNFGSDDFLGAMGGMAGGGGGRGGFRGGNSQSGITNLNSIGVNYSNSWGTKVTLNGSYFYNLGKNKTDKVLDRQYILSGSNNQAYNEGSYSNSTNDNHRLNLKLEYNINDRNSIIFTPRLSFQKNTSDNSLMASSSSSDTLRSSTKNINNTESNGYNFNNDLLYRYKFGKKGRTVSLGVTTGISKRERDNYFDAMNLYYVVDPNKMSDSTRQYSNTLTDGVTLSSNLVYTEPLSEKSQVQLNYTVSNSTNNNDKSTYNYQYETGEYSVFDTLLSNIYNNDYITHNVGTGYLYKDEKLNVNAGIAYQYSVLNGNQDFPAPGETHKTFNNFLPSLMLNYKAGDLVNLRINFRSSSNAPSVTQLQSVVDNSNPLLLSAGNPFLKQETRHNLRSRLSLANKEKTSNFFAMLSFQVIQDYIGNTTSIAANDTLVYGQEMRRGAQLIVPANLDGAWNARTLLSYGFPIKPVKCNFNVNAGVSYNRLPSLINNNRNISETYGINQGVVLSSNISQKLDFTLTYNLNYNLVDNSLQPELDNNYIFQISSAQFNWQFWKGLFIQSNLTYQNYNVISSKEVTEYTLLNSSIGSKLFKNNTGEIKLTIYDMLDQNKSLSRTVTDTYIENSTTQVLRQYVMLSFTYNLRNFKGKMPDMPEERRHDFGEPPHPPH
jgi:hypothetical protein